MVVVVDVVMVRKEEADVAMMGMMMEVGSRWDRTTL